MVYHPNKQDLARLKKSRPIPITAHTGEAVIPVVYTDMVNKFLDKQGIKLPLTHHQLAEFKAEAGVSGYAVGTSSLKKKKKKKKGKTIKNKDVNITINVGAGGGGGRKSGFGRARGGGFRGRNYSGMAHINPSTSYDPTKASDTTTIKLISDYNKLLEEQKRAEEKNKTLYSVSQASSEAVQNKLPMSFSSGSVPLVPNDNHIFSSIEQEEAKYSRPAVSGNTNTGSSSSYGFDSNNFGYFDDIINIPSFNIELPPEEPPSKLFEKFKKNIAGEELIKVGNEEYTRQQWNAKRKEIAKENRRKREEKETQEDRNRRRREIRDEAYAELKDDREVSSSSSSSSSSGGLKQRVKEIMNRR